MRAVSGHLAAGGELAMEALRGMVTLRHRPMATIPPAILRIVRQHMVAITRRAMLRLPIAVCLPVVTLVAIHVDRVRVCRAHAAAQRHLEVDH